MNLAIIFEGDKEKDIDKMISEAKIHEHNHGMARFPADEPILLQPILRLVHTRKPLSKIMRGAGRIMFRRGSGGMFETSSPPLTGFQRVCLLLLA